MRLAWLAALVPLAACGPDETTSACKDSFVAGDLVITEVYADYAAPTGGTGTDDGKEWFEIYNNSDRAVSLKGVSVVHSKPTGDTPKTHSMDDVTLAPGQFFTLGNATQDLLPAYVDYGFSADLGDFYNTGGGKLTLKCGDNEIDSAVYDLVKSGHSRQLTNQSPPDYTLNDDQMNWCEAKDSEFESNNFGTPGTDNDCAPVISGACSDNGVSRAVVPPAPGDLVITEVMPSPTGTDGDQEWFEIKANAAFDLNGLGIGRASDTTPEIIAVPECVHVDTGSYVVFAHKTDMVMNGGLPAASVIGTFATALVGGTTTAPGDIQITANGAVIDVITWTSSRTGKTLQLDPDVTNVTANDDPTNFCDGTTSYGAGGLGTPGAANAQCASQPPMGKCDDNGTQRDIVKPTVGNLVITEVLPNPFGTGTDATQEWFEIKNIGGTDFDLNGLLVGGATSTTPIQSTACKSVAAGAYALFAHSIDPAVNGGLPEVDATFTFALGSRVQILDGTTVLDDAAMFGTVSDGYSKQLQPAMTDTVSNDDPANMCKALVTQQYNLAITNYGTPKAVNACVP